MTTDVPPALFAEAVITTDYNSYPPVAAEQIDTVPENASGLYCEAVGCNNELVYAGRGRRPKFCSLHKKSGGTKSDKPPTSARGGVGKLRDDFREMMFTGGVLLTPYDQYDAAVLISRADPTADVIAMFAARYPKFRQWLEKGGDGMMWVKAAMAIAAIGIPIGAHHGLIPMDERTAYKRFVDKSVDDGS